MTIAAYIVKTVTGLKPIQVAQLKDWPHLQGLPLADPEFLEFSHIDMLLGSVVFGEIVQCGLVKGTSDEPIAQLTSLGWIVSGAANKIEEKEISCNVILEEESISQQLAAFWQIEEINQECFGESYSIAKRRYHSTQRRLTRNPELQMKYDEGLQEYIILGHMELATEHDKPFVCLPHHPVIKEASTTTKQPPDTTEIQRYKLNTLTFGVASSPFQAIGALHQIGEDVKKDDSELARNIQEKFYVDDYLGCEMAIDKAIEMQRKITNTLAKYGFHLRKWKSSHGEILQEVTHDHKEQIMDIESTIKTLGISWNPNSDEFVFKPAQRQLAAINWTKRNVLSEIAKLFDPIGWMASVVIKAKLVMQDIWREGESIGWDSPLTPKILEQWEPIAKQLSTPIPITIPRWIGLSNEMDAVEIHGFADASKIAYAAAIYMRIIHKDGSIKCNLIASKTKVTPIRPLLTIPRLELCGAWLLAQLYEKTVTALSIEQYTTHAWTDSMITLSWLAAHPSKWSVIVANRVSQIHDILPFDKWLHVPTDQNPADIASRGMLINELKESSMWWQGPYFLHQPMHDWDTTVEIIQEEKLPERNNTTVFTVQVQENDTLNRFSDYQSLLRITALINRWKDKSKKRIDSLSNPLIATEINKAETQWIKIIQTEYFKNEIAALKRKDSVSPNSSLAKLNPFLDREGLLRMNGRVNNDDIAAQKTALILPAHSHFTELLIRYTHANVLHGGVQLTLRALRERFWIIHARTAVKSIIHKCVTCIRFNKSLLKQKMAELPITRTQQFRPFAFTGYFNVKTSELRNAPFTKGYVALFICFATKAIHLELVTSLTTADFILAFDNFISRRGIPTEFHSDNATTFIGASKEIKEMHDQWFNQNKKLNKILAEKRIVFKTIPARACHMGGIWERSIGLVKNHLYRVLKNVKLTARHFDNVLKQIEACVNSRPLWAVSSETDDCKVLTPSHFYNFQPIHTLPKPDALHIPINQLDQCQYLYRLYSDFWSAWSKEYLHQLQPRDKWTTAKANTTIGQIFIISDDNMPPSRWKL
ncbi:uncharacterized protein LOC129580173, partial [Sitodiplosis mosellana]|uniref:uncharacterized protein LOC129580173 n=1 Tax=Sitodiplosis mosellana TaxID=263140 RepID=UPI00244426C3